MSRNEPSSKHVNDKSMGPPWLMLVFGAALAVGGCVGEEVDPVRGNHELANSTKTEDHPAIVFVKNTHTGGGCSGVVIGERTVLTAGHCLMMDAYLGLINIVGAANIDVYTDADMTSLEGKKRFDAHAILAHPGYAGVNKSDIGLILLGEELVDEELQSIEPMELAVLEPMSDETINVLGYGASNISQNSDHRQIGVGTVTTVYDGYFSYSSDNGAAALCFRDSGGPSLVERGGGALEIAGIHSGTSAAACGSGNSFDIRVDVFADWIAENANGAE